MPFDANRLALTVDSIGGGSLRIHFLRTDDDRDEVTAPGYLRFASRLGVREGDVVIVYNEALADLDQGTYLTRVAPDFVNGHASLIEDVGEKPLPPFHFRVNDGEGGVSATYDQARVLLEIDHLPNKTEEEMVESGAISEALATKATPSDIDAKVDPIRSDLTRRATIIYVDESVAPIAQSLGNLSEDVGELQDDVSALAAGQASDAIIAKTWTSLSSTPPTKNGAKAEIPGTAITTHNDPVATGNPVVPDPGTYRGSLSPLGWERVGPTTAAAAAAEVGKGIATITLPLGPNFGVVFKNLTTGELVDLNNPDSIAWIQEIAVPTLYPKEPEEDIVLTETSSIILGADKQRSGDLLIQLLDKADAAFNFVDKPAVFGATKTWPQKDGQWVNHGPVGTGAVSGIVRRVAGDTSTAPLAVKINVRVQRRVDAPLPTRLADAIFARWPDPADSRFKDAIRAEIDYLYDRGILQKLKVWFVPGATRANNMVNLADPNGPLFVCHDGAGETPIETQPYKFMRGNGVDQYIDTQRLPADIGMTLNGHFLAAKIYPGGGVKSDGFATGNSVNFGMQPSRDANLYGFRSGSSTEVNDTSQPNYLWAGLSRDNDPANFSAFIDEAKIWTRPRALAAMPTRTLNILAVNSTGGVGLPTNLPVHGVGAGFGLADLSVIRFFQANKRIQAVTAAIVGG